MAAGLAINCESSIAWTQKHTRFDSQLTDFRKSTINVREPF